MKTLKLLCLLFLILLCDCQARILRITTSASYSNILTIFDKAVKGDTILFSPGLHQLYDQNISNITIGKSLFILGEDGAVVYTSFNISNVNECHIANLMIVNRNGHALSISKSKNVHLNGVYLYGSYANSDYNYDLGNGLTVTQCDSVSILNSYMEGYGGYGELSPWPGASFSSSTNIYIDSCKLKGGFNINKNVAANSFEAVDSSEVYITNSKLISSSFADISSSITTNNTNIIEGDTGLQLVIDKAEPNVTIHVPKGIYRSLRIRKPIKLSGDNKLNVIINNFLSIDSTNSIYLDNIIIKTDLTEAIRINNSYNIHIKNADIIAGDSYFQGDLSITSSGIKITNSDSIIISNSYISGKNAKDSYGSSYCWPGVYSIKSTNIVIDSSVLEGGSAKTTIWYKNKYYATGRPSSIIALDSSTLFVSNSHLLSRAFSDSTSAIIFNNVIGVNDEEKEGGTPSSYFLSQNYPNPFNPTTIISYDLPAESFITLKVYDILGREIAVLVNEVQKAGSHKVNFNGSMLSSGVYIYRLQTNNHSFSKKMIFQK